MIVRSRLTPAQPSELLPGLRRARQSSIRRWSKTLQPADDQQGWLDHPVQTPQQVRELIQICMGICRDTLGQVPYWTQVVAAVAVVQGRIVEMNTGEGKSLTGLLAALLAASQRWPVHIVTANDYLAARDHQSAQPLFDSLGLSSAALLQDQEPEARAQALGAQILFTTGKELVFEALRDRLALGDATDPVRHAALRLAGKAPARPFVRGLGLAILDEADSVLIDEASTPCVISAAGGSVWPVEDLQHALGLAAELSVPHHLTIEGQSVKLTSPGQRYIENHGQRELPNRLYRQTLVQLAATALHAFQREVDYVVLDDAVVIVDALTGRLMPDRRWEQGLHELIEVKEGLPPSGSQRTVGKMTYPQFFKRYPLLSGMTGTASEVRRELKQVYGLRLCVVPPRVPSRRQFAGLHWARTPEEKYTRLVDACRRRMAAGQPVLIGTPSIDICQAVSAELERAGIPHQRLDGQQDQDEADKVSQAGMPGQVTVATAVAGRGTDIRLDAAVTAVGGLHVILTECQFSARVDRQLIGRCARQGDPGSYEILACDADDIFQHSRFRSLAQWSPSPGSIRYAVRRAQQSNERAAMKKRGELTKSEVSKAKWLSFLKQA